MSNHARRSRRRLSTVQRRMVDALGPLDGQTLPGGCDWCAAEHEVRPASTGVWSVEIRHDPECLFWAAVRAATPGGPP